MLWGGKLLTASMFSTNLFNFVQCMHSFLRTSSWILYSLQKSCNYLFWTVKFALFCWKFEWPLWMPAFKHVGHKMPVCQLTVLLTEKSTDKNSTQWLSTLKTIIRILTAQYYCSLPADAKITTTASRVASSQGNICQGWEMEGIRTSMWIHQLLDSPSLSSSQKGVCRGGQP